MVENKPSLISRPEFDKIMKDRAPQKEKLGCGFCEWQEQRVNAVFDNWVWVDAISPYWSSYVREYTGLGEFTYKKVAGHTLLVPKTHAISFSDLSPEAIIEFGTLHKKIVDIYKGVNLYTKNEDGEFKQTKHISVYFKFPQKERRSLEGNHLHVHFFPERDWMFQPTLDSDAHVVDTNKGLLELYNEKTISS